MYFRSLISAISQSLILIYGRPWSTKSSERVPLLWNNVVFGGVFGPYRTVCTGMGLVFKGSSWMSKRFIQTRQRLILWHFIAHSFLIMRLDWPQKVIWYSFRSLFHDYLDKVYCLIDHVTYCVLSLVLGKFWASVMFKYH